MFKSRLVSLIAVLWAVTELAMLEASDEAMLRRAFWPCEKENSLSSDSERNLYGC